MPKCIAVLGLNKLLLLCWFLKAACGDDMKGRTFSVTKQVNRLALENPSQADEERKKLWVNCCAYQSNICYFERSVIKGYCSTAAMCMEVEYM